MIQFVSSRPPLEILQHRGTVVAGIGDHRRGEIAQIFGRRGHAHALEDPGDLAVHCPHQFDRIRMFEECPIGTLKDHGQGVHRRIDRDLDPSPIIDVGNPFQRDSRREQSIEIVGHLPIGRGSRAKGVTAMHGVQGGLDHFVFTVSKTRQPGIDHVDHSLPGYGLFLEMEASTVLHEIDPGLGGENTSPGFQHVRNGKGLGRHHQAVDLGVMSRLKTGAAGPGFRRLILEPVDEFHRVRLFGPRQQADLLPSTLKVPGEHHADRAVPGDMPIVGVAALSHDRRR